MFFSEVNIPSIYVLEYCRLDLAFAELIRDLKQTLVWLLLNFLCLTISFY